MSYLRRAIYSLKVAAIFALAVALLGYQPVFGLSSNNYQNNNSANGSGAASDKLNSYLNCLNESSLVSPQQGAAEYAELTVDDVQNCLSGAGFAAYYQKNGVSASSLADCYNKVVRALTIDDLQNCEKALLGDAVSGSGSQNGSSGSNSSSSSSTVKLPTPALQTKFDSLELVAPQVDRTQSFPFTLLGFEGKNIGSVRGFLIKSGKSYEKHLTKISETRYSFEWNTANTAVGDYKIRIVVREAPRGEGAVGGRLLLASETPVVVTENEVAQKATIVENQPVLNEDETAVIFSGKVEPSGNDFQAEAGFKGGADSESSKIEGADVVLYYTISQAKNGGVVEKSSKAVSKVQKDGSYAINLNYSLFTSALTGKGRKIQADASAISSVINGIKTVILVTNPGFALAYGGYKVVSYFTKKGSAAQNSSGGAGTAQGGSGGAGTAQGGSGAIGANLGLGSLLGSLGSLVNNLSGGDPQGELESRAVGVVNLLISFASILLGLAVVWTGLLYIFAMGNPEQAEHAKKNFTVMIIGLAALLAALFIVNIVRTLLTTGSIV